MIDSRQLGDRSIFLINYNTMNSTNELGSFQGSENLNVDTVNVFVGGAMVGKTWSSND